MRIAVIMAALVLCSSQTRPRHSQVNSRQIQLFPGDRTGTAVQPVQIGYGGAWHRSVLGRECVRAYLPITAEVEARLVAAGYREGYTFGGLRVKAACRCDWCKP